MNTFQTIIDWQELVDGYNKKYKTTFENEKALLKGLLLELSPTQIGDRLGVSFNTIYRRLDGYGIARSHKRGGPNYLKTPKKDAFLAVPVEIMSKMTATQLASKLDMNISSVYRFLRKTGRIYLRERKI